MLDLDIIDTPAAASLALDPIKARLLAELSIPSSAATLAGRVGLTRQKVNYHLKALEEHKLVEQAEERHWGGITERLMIASARSYVVSPAALGPVGATPEAQGDRFSTSYLVALAARTIREVGALWRSARQADKLLATLSIDTTIRFASPAARAAFTEDLMQAVTALAARYHDEHAPGGRPHRLVAAAYPAPPEKERTSDADEV